MQAESTDAVIWLRARESAHLDVLTVSRRHVGYELKVTTEPDVCLRWREGTAAGAQRGERSATHVRVIRNDRV
jgi:hypothetical protein